MRIASSDGTNSFEKQFTITATDVNEAPTNISLDNSSVAENQPSGTTVGNFSATDPDAGDTASYSFVSGTGSDDNGSFTITGNTLKTAASFDFETKSSYSIRVAVTDSGSLTYEKQFTISVTNVNEDPTAVDDTATVLEDSGATSIPVLANDTDPEGDAMTITGKTDGAHGTVAITGGGTGLTYTPDANYCGAPDTFTYTINGGSTANVTADVTCVNDAPSFTKGPDQNVPNQDSGGANKAYTIDPWATGVSAGPSNESTQTVDFVINSVSNSTLFAVQPTVSASGALSFTTDAAQAGTSTVVLHIHDDGGTADGGVDASATQSFTITTVLPPPDAVDDPAAANAAHYAANGGIPIDIAAGIGVTQNDVMHGGAINGYGASTGSEQTSIGSPTPTAGGGSVTLNADGSFHYEPPITPPAGGTDTFKYRLHNAGGSDIATVTITVTGQAIFLDNTAAAGGNGTLPHPYDQLSDIPATRANGGVIYFFNGSGTYTRSDASAVALKSNEVVLGQGVGFAGNQPFTLAPDHVALPTAGSTPSLTTTFAGGNDLSLAAGNTVKGLALGNAPGSAISGSSFGTLTVNTSVSINTNKRALNLATGTLAGSFSSITSTGGTDNILLFAVATTSTSSLGSGALSAATTDGLKIIGASGSFDYSGTISNTTIAQVVVQNKTGGTINLSGQISGTGTAGVLLDTNASTTINLTGGVQISTGGNNAFTATNSGTVTVTGSSNTLASNTGTALNVSNTTIGGSGATFQSIASNGAASGIVLNNTGSSGSLSVTGTGSSGTGGTITNSTGPGISLTSTTSPSFSWMNVTNGGDDGIRASSVAGLSLSNLSVSGNGNAAGEGGLDATGQTGTVTIASSTFTGSADTNASIFSGLSGTLGVTVTGSTFTNTSASTGSDGMHVDSDGSTNATVSVTGSTFTHNRGDQFQFATNASATGTNNVTFSSNTLTGDRGTTYGGTDLGGGLTLSTDASSTTNYTISGNSIQGATDRGILIDLGTASTAGGLLSGTISNNSVGIAATVDSGSVQFDDVGIVTDGAGNNRATITGNTLVQYGNSKGIRSSGGTARTTWT